MKLRDRYPHLQNPAVVKAMVLESVYASMALENQIVSMERLEVLYAQTERLRQRTQLRANKLL